MVFDSQKVYRLILEAMSNPGRIVNIKKYADKLFGDNPAFLAAAMTLLDNETSFNACENGRFSDEIASLTLAKRETLEDADFIFACDFGDIKSAIQNAKRGTLSDPHKSATIAIQNDGTPSLRLTLAGPGIDGRVTLDATQTVKCALDLRDAQKHEYPQGVDLLFISSAGELAAVPRLVREVR
jgi:alpha-D-ribose 1-methylphosphonate 5-triphosphate synthase subunit PhnH